MKYKLRLNHQKSVLRQYLTSYLGLVLAICVIFSATLFTLAVRELDGVSMEETQIRIHAIAGDLNVQYDIMRDISLKVSINYIFKPSYLQQNKYNEVELLRELAKFEYYSPIADSYYMLYDGDDMVYRPQSHAKGKLTFFLRDTLGYESEEDAQAVYVDILNRPTAHVIKTPAGDFLFCFPLRFESRANPEACLCFLVTGETFRHRFLETGGVKYGDVTVTFNDQLLTESGTSSNLIYEETNARGFTVSYYAENAYRRMNDYQKTFWISVGVILVVFIILAIRAAKRNYQPIRELTMDTNLDIGYGVNEFVAISNAIRKNMEANKMTRKQLEENIKWLDQQRMRNQEMIYLLALTGNQTSIHLDGTTPNSLESGDKSFLTLLLLPEEGEFSKNKRELIESLSDNGTNYCLVRLPYEGIWAVVVSFDGEPDIAYSTALLRSLFDSWKINVKIGCGTVCSDLRELTDSFVVALRDLEQADDTAGMWHNEGMMSLFVNVLRNGDSKKAQSLLSDIFACIEKESTSYLYTCCSIAEIANVMLRISEGAGMDMTPEIMSMILRYNQPTVMREKMSVLAEEICAHFAEGKGQKETVEQHEIIDYLEDHLEDYNLSLSTAAEDNHTSVKRLEQLIQQQTGYTFKEYVIIRRMEVAKKMLAEGRSVSDTGKALCYNSISYFIKAFRKYTGMTPTDYRKSLENKSGQENATGEKENVIAPQ